jgi:hypothetical protein
MKMPSSPIEHKMKLYFKKYHLNRPSPISPINNIKTPDFKSMIFSINSPSLELHTRFLDAIGYTSETEDKANWLLSMEIQLGWLRDTGFVDVDYYWKWHEMALLI